MMSLWMLLCGVVAFFLAWNNGSNNAANMVGTAVGSGAISAKKALALSALFTFIGAMLLGSYVTDTVMRKIVVISNITESLEIVCMMLSVLISSSIWTLVSSILRIPMSVHACVLGSLVGAGLVVGVGVVDWFTLARIFISWLLVPPIAMVISFLMFRAIEKALASPSSKTIYIVVSLCSFLSVFIPIYLSFLKSLSVKVIVIATVIAAMVGVIATVIAIQVLKHMVRKGLDPVDVSMKILLIEAVISMSFAFGSNDVANAAGPFAASLFALGMDLEHAITVAVALGGAALSLGILLWGSSVIETVGKKITTLSPTSAFVAQLTAAIVMAVLSRLGIPASTSMAIVGSVAGVGMAKGLRYVNKRMLLRIFGMWYLAIPCTAGLAYLIFFLLRQLV